MTAEALVDLKYRKRLQSLDELKKVFGGIQTQPNNCAQSGHFGKRMDLTKPEQPLSKRE
jgi:hypothetical protein